MVQSVRTILLLSITLLTLIGLVCTIFLLGVVFLTLEWRKESVLAIANKIILEDMDRIPRGNTNKRQKNEEEFYESVQSLVNIALAPKHDPRKGTLMDRPDLRRCVRDKPGNACLTYLVASVCTVAWT